MVAGGGLACCGMNQGPLFGWGQSTASVSIHGRMCGCLDRLRGCLASTHSPLSRSLYARSLDFEKGQAFSHARAHAPPSVSPVLSSACSVNTRGKYMPRAPAHLHPPSREHDFMTICMRGRFGAGSKPWRAPTFTTWVTSPIATHCQSSVPRTPPRVQPPRHCLPPLPHHAVHPIPKPGAVCRAPRCRRAAWRRGARAKKLALWTPNSASLVLRYVLCMCVHMRV